MDGFSDEHLSQVSAGTVPWDVDQCIELMQFQTNLSETPKDDWDLTERPLGSNLRLNMFAPMNQLGMYAVGKLDEKFAHHHMWRLMQIMQFLDDNTDALIERGFCRTHEGQREFCRPLLQALCNLPFNREYTTDKGHEHRTFDFAEVASETERLSEDAG